MDTSFWLQTFANCSKDAQPCGHHIAHELGSIVSALRSSSLSDSTVDCIAKRCSLLVTQASEAIATFPYADVPDHWRRLYMDATLLRALACISPSSASPTAHELLQLIKALDMANIVTAYFDNGRREAFFGIMQCLQASLSTHNGRDALLRERPHKRSKVVEGSASPPPVPLLPSIQQIHRYTMEDAPSFETLSEYTKPFVITGGVSHWPAISDVGTRWKDESYLLSVSGKGRIVPVEIGSSYTAEGWTQKMMPFEEFLNRIDWSTSSTEQKQSEGEAATLYLAQHDLFQQFPELLSDIVPPDYVFADMPAPAHFLAYRPPLAQAGYTINAWMGPKGTYSPAHTDPYHNCYAQVVGSKHIWVAAPDVARYMREESPSLKGTSDGDVSSGDEARAEGRATPNAASQYMDNTATIDVFHASTPSTTVNEPTEFQQHVAPRAMQAILKEGDLLFMPPK